MGTGASSGRRNPQLNPASQTQRNQDEQPVVEGAGSRPLGHTRRSSTGSNGRGSLASDDTLIHCETMEEDGDHSTRRFRGDLLSWPMPPPLPGLRLRPRGDHDDESSLSSYSHPAATPTIASRDTDTSSFLEPSISELQQRRVRHCLATLEGVLEISFHIDNILSDTQVVSLEENEEVIRQGTEAKGIYVVEEGHLEVLSPNGDTVLNQLLPDEFCGELSTLFEVSCTATVRAEHEHRVTLLWLPLHAIKENMEGELRREQMLQWCVKRSYVDTAQLFGTGVLLQQSIANCLKASLFSDLSKEAIDFLSQVSTPMLFNAGDILYSSGEEPDNLFFVLRGAVECSTNARTKTVKCSDEGYCAGIEDFSWEDTRTSEARCMGPLLVVPISRELLTQVANKFPVDLPKLKNYLYHNY